MKAEVLGGCLGACYRHMAQEGVEHPDSGSRRLARGLTSPLPELTWGFRMLALPSSRIASDSAVCRGPFGACRDGGNLQGWFL